MYQVYVFIIDFLNCCAEVTSNVIDVETITSTVAELSSTDEDINQESTEVCTTYSTKYKIHYNVLLGCSCSMLFTPPDCISTRG